MARFESHQAGDAGAEGEGRERADGTGRRGPQERDGEAVAQEAFGQEGPERGRKAHAIALSGC